MEKKAFTLAEVLITLGIIGIIAAITLPAVLSNYRAKKAAAQLKKMYSMFAQAKLLSEIDNGPSDEWDKKSMAMEDGSENIQGNRQLALNYFNKYFKPYMKYTSIDENPKFMQNSDGESYFIVVYLADGSAIGFRNGSCAHIRFFLNGAKSKASGKDMFDYLICQSSQTSLAYSNKGFGPYCPNCTNRANSLSACSRNGMYCAALIMIDGWEFKKDYPHKL